MGSLRMRQDRTVRRRGDLQRNFWANRVLAAVDNYSRVGTMLRAGQSYGGADVVASPEVAVEVHGYPRRIRLDTGLEFVARDLNLWAYANGVVLDFSRPGKPTDNAIVEGFNRCCRQERLNQNRFLSIEDAQAELNARRRSAATPADTG